jgi:phospholipid transport system substrate-binding protein
MQAALILLVALAAQGGATEAVKARDQEIRAALPERGEPSPEARKKIEAIVTKTVDLPGMLQSALGARWKELTEAQRKRLVGAFEHRFRQLSGKELDSYRSTKIEYLPEAEAPGGAVKVPTRVVVQGEPTEIAYAMREEKGGWRIVDVIVDGVSTVENYRSSFNRVIAKEGVDGLIKRLEKGTVAKAPTAKGEARQGQ